MVLAALAILTFRQARVYENRVTLWEDTLRKNPASWMAHANLGTALFDQGRLTAADDAFARALELDAAWVPGLEGRGDVARAEGRLGDAEVGSLQLVLHHQYSLPSTISLPCIRWCPRPQYSLQTTPYSPALSGLIVTTMS